MYSILEGNNILQYNSQSVQYDPKCRSTYRRYNRHNTPHFLRLNNRIFIEFDQFTPG